MLSAVLVSPVLHADMDTLAFSLSRYRQTTSEIFAQGQERERQLLRDYIEHQCAAYILREAHTLGIEDIRITVRAKWTDETWVPYETQAEGNISAEQKEKLCGRIEAELGIPRERQRWNE